MTNDDLKTMQAWPLDRKIRVSQTRIMEWYRRWDGNVSVNFSGGKDSTVLLDMARRVYPDIEAVFVDTGLEYPAIREFVKTKENVNILKPKMNFKKVLDTYGYPVVSKEVSEAVKEARIGLAKGDGSYSYRIERLRGTYKDKDGNPSRYNKKKWGFLLEAPFKISDECCDVMKKEPLKRYQKESGKYPIIGTMAAESLLRRNSWLRFGCNIVDSREPRSRPLSFWTEQDILKYLVITNIPYASVYGDIVEEDQMTMLEPRYTTTGAKRTGCMFCMFGAHLEERPNRFEQMKETHPKQYDYCINKLGCGEVLDYIGAPY